MKQQSPKKRLEAEYHVKGSELLPHDSSRYELDVHNAILLYELVIDNLNMKQERIAMKIESK